MLVLMFVGLLSSMASPAEELDAPVVVNSVEDCGDGQTCVLASQLDKCSKEELYQALAQVTSALEPSTWEVIFEGETADEIRASRAAERAAAAKAYTAALGLLERCPKGGTIIRVDAGRATADRPEDAGAGLER